MIKLGPHTRLPKEAITQTFGILAVRGAGKTNTAVVMAEEMSAAKLPFVVIDPVGNWWGLRAGADGKSPGLSIPIFGGQHGDVPLEKTGGVLVADLVVDERLSAVLDVAEFSEGDKIRFLIDFAERLYRRNSEPLHLFLEEADDYCPQRPMREQARLLRAWENVVRRGRSRGLGMTMITQRSAALNKNVLTQIETLIVLRTTSPQDRKAIEGWVDYHGQSREIIDSLPSLENGEAWVWSPTWLKVCERVQIRKRETYDSAATPTLIKRAAATLADIDLPTIRQRMASTIEKAKAEDPRLLKAEVASLRQQKVDLEAFIKKQSIPKAQFQRVEVPVVKERQIKRLESLFTKISNEAMRHGKTMSLFWQNQNELADSLLKAVQSVVQEKMPKVDHRGYGTRVTNHSVGDPVRPPHVHRLPQASTAGLSRSQQRILNGLAWAEGMGLLHVDKVQLALLSDQRPTSGGYFNNLGALRSVGLLEYPTPGMVCLTDRGRKQAEAVDVPRTSDELQQTLFNKLSMAQSRILKVLIRQYPDAVSKEKLAEEADQKPTSGGYFNNLGRLRSLGLIDYPRPGLVVAKSVLFLTT